MFVLDVSISDSVEHFHRCWVGHLERKKVGDGASGLGYLMTVGFYGEKLIISILG